MHQTRTKSIWGIATPPTNAPDSSVRHFYGSATTVNWLRLEEKSNNGGVAHTLLWMYAALCPFCFRAHPCRSEGLFHLGDASFALNTRCSGSPGDNSGRIHTRQCMRHPRPGIVPSISRRSPLRGSLCRVMTRPCVCGTCLTMDARPSLRSSTKISPQLIATLERYLPPVP